MEHRMKWIVLVIIALVSTGAWADDYNDLTISALGGGTITAPAGGAGTYSYLKGTVVDIAGVADPHYHFVNWTGSGVDLDKVENPALASTTITVDINCAVVANFAIDQHSLTTSTSQGGTVTTPGINTYWYPYGTVVPIVATASTNCTFVNWTGTAVDEGKVANANLPSTTVPMHGNYGEG